MDKIFIVGMPGSGKSTMARYLCSKTKFNYFDLDEEIEKNSQKSITEILFDKGYILSYKFEDDVNHQGNIKIALKYNSKNPAIKKLIRVSKPGLRKYANKETMPRVINGLGIAIISTSKGVITDKEARNLNVGGEVICYVY